MFRRYMPAMLLAFSAQVFATGVVGVNAQKITDIRVSPLNANSFSIKTTRPSAPPPGTPSTEVCEGSWVTFKKENYASQDAFDRAYSLAITAMSMNKPIYVIVASASDCTTATTIAFMQ